MNLLNNALKTNIKFTRKLPVAWIVGGSSKLGLAIADNLLDKYDLVNLSRHQGKGDSDKYLNISLDLANKDGMDTLLEELISATEPRAVIFCQRYRALSSDKEADVLEAINVEIISTQRIIEFLIKKALKKPCSIVVISSSNGMFVNKNIPFWYHWLKSSQIQLVKYYSVSNSRTSININCIAPNTFTKDQMDSYPSRLKIWFEKLKKTVPVKRVTDISDIASVIRFLISDNAIMINGQIISIDGGITNIFQETLI
jgi:3-oxoacyl-[acyl-carrier protein] reductase